MSITECKCESPQEALERFEEAVRNHTGLNKDTHFHEYVSITEEYKAAKAELLTWMSYIP